MAPAGMAVGVAVGTRAVEVADTGVSVGLIAVGVGLAVASDIGPEPLLVNWIAPMSGEDPRGLAKKSLEMPISAALPAAGEELPGR